MEAATGFMVFALVASTGFALALFLCMLSIVIDSSRIARQARKIAAELEQQSRYPTAIPVNIAKATSQRTHGSLAS
jgi:hypothetical protein